MNCKPKLVKTIGSPESFMRTEVYESERYTVKRHILSDTGEVIIRMTPFYSVMPSAEVNRGKCIIMIEGASYLTEMVDELIEHLEELKELAALFEEK